MMLRPPRLDLAPAVLGVADEPAASAACAHAVAALLAGVDAVAARIADKPLVLLASGGVSVKDLRALAAAERPPTTVALVLRLLERAGLVAATRKDLRLSSAWADWAARDDAIRWLSLVTAWLDDSSAPTARAGSDRPLRGLGFDWDDRLVASRQRLVPLLSQRRGQAGTTQEWLRAWHVRWPAARLRATDRRGHLVESELRADLLAEAEVLGLLAAGAPSPLALALHDGVDVAAVLVGMSDAGVSRVRAQADLTLIATGRPSRAMRQALDAFADVESAEHATVWRVSEASLGRAYAQGLGPDDVLAVLEEHAAPVPQPMAYLVKDAHRRYAPVTVGVARTFVLADDERLVAALGRKGPAAKAVKAVKLVRVAPGVAVSQASQEATVAALKELGLHADQQVVRAAGRRVAAPAPRVRPVKGLPVFDLSAPARAAAERLLGQARS
jgi:hypothetical protein